MENRNRNVWIIVAVVVILLCCLLAALAAVAVFGLGWFGTRVFESGVVPDLGAAQVTETQEMTFEVGMAPNLVIDNFAGNILIQSGSEGIISAVANRRALGRSNLQDIVVQPSQEGDMVRIRTMRTTSSGFSNVAVDLELTVPTGTRVELSNGAGDVRINDVAGEIVAHTGAGNVSVMGARGPVRLDTGAGNVEYEGQPQGTCTFETGAGNVEIALPADFSGSIDLDTGIGGVGVGGFDVDGSVSPGSARGTIGSGDGVTIEAHTGAGDIDLVRQ